MNHSKTKMLIEGAIMLALATVLSLIKVFELPWGGAVTLLSMLPICLFSIHYGVKKGLMVSFLYSLIQLFLSLGNVLSWGLNAGTLVACLLIDYIAAFTVLGLAGMFRSKGVPGWITGTAIAIFFRFCVHFISGVILWKSYGELWNGFSTDNTYLYSLLYNGAYMLPEMIFTCAAAVLLYKMPATKKLLTE